MLICGVFFLGSKYADSAKGFLSKAWSRRACVRLLKIGVPVGLYSGVETASFTIALLMVTQLGILPLATHQILSCRNHYWLLYLLRSRGSDDVFLSASIVRLETSPRYEK